MQAKIKTNSSTAERNLQKKEEDQEWQKIRSRRNEKEEPKKEERMQRRLTKPNNSKIQTKN